MLIKTVDLIKYQLQGVQLLLWAIQLNETVKEKYYSRFCFDKTVKEKILFQESFAEDRKPHLETRRTEEWNNKGDQNKSSSSLNLIRWPQKIIIGIILTEFDQVTYFFEAETELLCTPNYALFPFNTHSCQVAVSEIHSAGSLSANITCHKLTREIIWHISSQLCSLSLQHPLHSSGCKSFQYGLVRWQHLTTLFPSDCRKTNKKGFDNIWFYGGYNLQVGSWTKSTEKLQFLANKEMESKVMLIPFSAPLSLPLALQAGNEHYHL